MAPSETVDWTGLIEDWGLDSDGRIEILSVKNRIREFNFANLFDTVPFCFFRDITLRRK